MDRLEMGIALSLLERLRLYRIPRQLAQNERVSQGSRLDAADLRYLREALHNAQRLQPQWRLFSEFATIFGGLARLYHEITTKALTNEQASMCAETYRSIRKV